MKIPIKRIVRIFPKFLMDINDITPPNVTPVTLCNMM